MNKRLIYFVLLFLTCLSHATATVADDTSARKAFTIWEVDGSSKQEYEKVYKGNRPRIGLVLSGGGAKGIAHVGVLKVLEELDIPIDYIGGTSMGSIIGGMYAYGYTAHELDSILKAADWGVLLNDKPDWTDVYYSNKTNYILRLPFGFGENATITPIGFLKGQHINNLFYTLTSQAYKSKNFKEFNIPFFCVAADIGEGKIVYLEEGNLAQAMRASMAVPGVFAPVKMGDKLMVDGGVLNNFPVDYMQTKGVDIIIGVDVGFAYSGIQGVNSFMDVLEEVIFMGSKGKVMDNRLNCDVFIQPNMKGYSTTSFSKVDSLLSRGEQAARAPKVYQKLKQLSEDLKKYEKDPEVQKKPYFPQNSVFITKIEYEGLEKYNKGYVNQFMQIETGKWAKLQDITDGVDRLYGTYVFKSVAYEFKQDSSYKDGTILKISVEEAPSNTFNLGIKYDNERLAGLLAGLEFRNLGFKNSQLNLDVELSKLAMVTLDYTVMPNWRNTKSKFSLWVPSIGAGLDFYKISSYLYRNPLDFTERTSEIRSNRYRARIYGQSNWKLNILGLGITYEYAGNKEYISSAINRKDVFNNSYIYPYAYFKHNSFNEKYYPTSGSKMMLEVTFPISLNSNTQNTLPPASHFLSAYWTGDFAISLGKRICLYPGFTIGTILFKSSPTIPIQFQFFQGGCAYVPGWYSTMMPGVQLGQSSGYELINLRLTAQFMLFKNTYLSLRGGVGKAEYEIADMIKNFDRLIYGGNIGISYNTPIGPVGLSFQTSNVHNFGIYLNVGYWF